MQFFFSLFPHTAAAMDILALTRTWAFAFFAWALCIATVSTLWITIPQQQPPPVDSIVTTVNGTVSDDYEVTGYSCDPLTYERVDTDTIEQGDILTICVEVEERAINEGIFLEGVETFTWFRDDGAFINLNQVAIEDGVASRDGYTYYHCDPGSTMCYFRSILMSEYYMFPGEIFGAGTVSLAYASSLESGDTTTTAAATTAAATTTTSTAATTTTTTGDGVLRRRLQTGQFSFGLSFDVNQADDDGPPPVRRAGGVALTTNARTILLGSAVSTGLVVGASIVFGL
jgi:hypothetical protein